MRFWLLVLLAVPTAAVLARCAWIWIVEPYQSRQAMRQKMHDLIERDRRFDESRVREQVTRLRQSTTGLDDAVRHDAERQSHDDAKE